MRPMYRLFLIFVVCICKAHVCAIIHKLYTDEQWQSIQQRHGNSRDYLQHINERDSHGRTALYCAVQNKCNLMALQLLNSGAYVNEPATDGTTPIHQAVLTQNLALLFSLLTYNGDPNIKDDHGCTALHYAITMLSSKATVETLLQFKRGHHFICHPDIRDNDGQTPLYYAVKLKKCVHMQMLLDAGANPNICDKKGLSPFHVAIIEQHYHSVLTLILSKRVDLNLPDSQGRTPRTLSTYAHNESVRKIQEIINRALDTEETHAGTSPRSPRKHLRLGGTWERRDLVVTPRRSLLKVIKNSGSFTDLHSDDE